MTFIAWTLGAPVTEPGGKVARSSAASPWPGASSAADLGDEVPDARVRLGLGRVRRLDAAVLGHAPEVVAHQVDDHHVLRAVLLGALQRRRVARGAVPLIGPVVTVRPRRRRNSSGERLAIAAPRREEARAVGGLQLRHRVGEEVGDVAVVGRVEPQAEVGLEDLAGRDPLDAVRDRGDVRRPRRARGARTRWARGGGGLGRGGEQRAQVREARDGRPSRRTRAPRTTTVPSASMPQDMVVEREVGVRERVRARRARRERPRRARRGRSRASRTSRRRPRRRRAARADPPARANGSSPGASSARGAQPTIAPPPAQRPVSANATGLAAQREQDPLGGQGAVEVDDQMRSVA